MISHECVTAIQAHVNHQAPRKLTGVFSDEKVNLAKSCSTKLALFVSEQEPGLIYALNDKQIIKLCTTYVYNNYEPKGFLPPFIWPIIISFVVKWLLREIFPDFFKKELSRT